MSTATAMHADFRAADRGSLRVLTMRILSELMFWLVIAQLVAGFYLQSQLMLFDRVVAPNGIPKMGLVAMLVAGSVLVMLAHRGKVTNRQILIPALVLACYLLADLALLIQTSNVPIAAILFGFNKYFLFYLALPSAAMLRLTLTAKQMRNRLMILFVPLALVALAQYALNDPIFPTVVEDESFEIPAVDFYGQIRAFSLFRGVLECGQGMAFFGALMVAQLCVKRDRHLWRDGALLLLAAVACYATFRRGAHMEFGAAALSAVLITRGFPICRWLPWIFLTFALGLASYGSIIGSNRVDGMLSSDSLGERLEAWGEVVDKWLNQRDASMIVGTGQAQTSLLGTGLAQIESNEVDYLLVDNGFLSVGFQTGLLGLIIWFWVMQVMWKEMLDIAWRNGEPLAVATAALLATWMMRDVFDPLFAMYPLYVYLVYWSLPSENAPRPTSRSRSLEVACP